MFCPDLLFCRCLSRFACSVICDTYLFKHCPALILSLPTPFSCISTHATLCAPYRPTGSTAYSMSAGGSVAHPAVPAILLTPICPHVLSFRSMIFPDSVVLRCYVPEDARSDACVAFDGRYRRVLHRGDSVQIQMSQHPVPTINRMDHSADWLNSLKRNFNFNSRARQRPL